MRKLLTSIVVLFFLMVPAYAVIITLEWDAQTEGEEVWDSVRIYEIINGEYTLVGEVLGTLTTAAISATNTSHTYIVRSVLNGYESADSNSVTYVYLGETTTTSSTTTSTTSTSTTSTTLEGETTTTTTTTEAGTTTSSTTSTTLAGPTISNVVAVGSAGQITVTWDTDSSSDSRVFYGHGSYNYTASFDYYTLVTTHTATVSVVNSGMTYWYYVCSKGIGTAITCSATYTIYVPGTSSLRIKTP